MGWEATPPTSNYPCFLLAERHCCFQQKVPVLCTRFYETDTDEECEHAKGKGKGIAFFFTYPIKQKKSL